MARIYVSCTVADLEEERQAVIDWLVEAQHQPVHSYRPSSETVREGCLQDIDGCDLYVLILGHRYGFQPEEANPEKLSITQLEFRRAGEKGIPRVALLRTSIPNIHLSDYSNCARLELVRAFESEVRKAVRPAEFHDLHGLIQGLSTGVQSELEKVNQKRAPDASQVLNLATTFAGELERKNREIEELRGRVRELEQAAIARTVAAAEQPGASRAAVAAAAALEAGDTRPAEVQLGRQEDKEAARIGLPGAEDTQARREAAALAREQGALAMAHDVRAALEAFERAAEYDPDDVWTHFFLGDLLQSFGDLSRAMGSYQRAQAISEGRLARDAANTGWQRDLSVSYNRIGDVLVAQGDLPTALEAYRESLAIREKLAEHDAANTQWQRDLSVSHAKIGDVLVAQGDGPGALAAYRQSLAIREKLAGRDPANTNWQRDLSVSHERIGDVLVAQGDGPGALAAYRQSLSIREKLAARDAANTEWQRDLSVNHLKIGNVLAAQGDVPGALAAFRKAFGTAEKLAARDAANTGWQRDLSVSHSKIGEVLAAQGDMRGALAAHRNTLEIAEKLAARDPANAQWQTDLAVSCSKLGSLADQPDGARINYLRRGRAILQQLHDAGRLLPNQDERSWFDRELAKLTHDATISLNPDQL